MRPLGRPGLGWCGTREPLSVGVVVWARIFPFGPFDKNGCPFMGRCAPSSWANKIAKDQASSRSFHRLEI